MAVAKIISSTQNNTKEIPEYRLAPSNLEAEQWVLGAVLCNNEMLLKVSDFLLPEHFYSPAHGLIYSHILKFADRGLVASPVTLKNYMDQEPMLADQGGSAYLATLAGMSGNIFGLKDYAQSIYEASLRRQLIALGQDVVEESYTANVEQSPMQIVEQAEHKLYSLASSGEYEKGFQPLTSALTESIRRAENALQYQDSISGIPTAFRDLDKLLGGLHDSDLLILAARPSMGKTALAVNVAYNAAKYFHAQHKLNNAEPQALKSVGFFSLEMSAEQLATRMLSMATDLGSSDIRRGRIDPKRGDLEKLLEGNRQLAELPFFIDDTPALTIAAVRTRARRLKRKYNLGLLVVDYLQLLRGVGKAGSENRVQEVSEITQGLKAIAKELNIPVLALSQLSRAVESRDDKRPQLSDLRESGSIEQDADVVMFIFREAYYIERKKPNEDSDKFPAWFEEMQKVNNLAEVMIAKHRNGAIGNVTMHFDGLTTRFGNHDGQHFAQPLE
jgi:replicative DNA helicase